jgi:hypothetical protein
MKMLDLIRIALMNLKGRWVVLPVAGISISVFCLCFSGAILTIVQYEKSLPCELAVSVQGSAGLSDSMIAKLSDIPGVTAVTPLLQVPVTVNSGVYTAQLALTGIDAAYLEDPFTKGGVFPDSSVMPYIILNEAACRQFSNGKEESDTMETGTTITLSNINWLNADFSVQVGDGARPVISKVCGVLAGQEGQEPAAYISLSTAKALLKSSGQRTAYVAAKVRAVNIGYADSVSKTIAALGFTIGNINEEQQSRWDTQTKEMGYLIVTGLFSLLCSLFLISAGRRISLLEQKESWTMLRWLGLKERDISRLFILQAGMISLFGVAIGIIIGVSLSSFLPLELKSDSIFMLPIPTWIVVASAVICTTSCLLTILKTRGFGI